jgi:hypothetical protein
VFTPNDVYVRWHWADIPARIDVGSFRLHYKLLKEAKKFVAAMARG